MDARAQAVAEFRETLHRIATGIEQQHQAEQQVWDELSWLDKRLVTVGSGFNSLWEGVKGIGSLVMSGIEAYGDAREFMTQLSANVVSGNFDAAQQQSQGAAMGIQQKTSALKDDALAAVQMMQDITAFIAAEPEAQKALLEFGERVGKSIGSAQVATLVGDVIVSAAVAAVSFGAGAAIRAAKVGDNVGDAASAVLGLFRKIGGRSGGADNVIGEISRNADTAVELTRRAVARGRISTDPQAFGTRAHTLFKRLNNRLDRRLDAQDSPFTISSEEFRDASGALTGRRVPGSIGADAVLRDSTDPNFLRIFDLKTYRSVPSSISPARQSQFQQRFGTTAEEIFRQQ